MVIISNIVVTVSVTFHYKVVRECENICLDQMFPKTICETIGESYETFDVFI